MPSRGLKPLLFSSATFKWLIILVAFLTAAAAFFSPPAMVYQPHQVTLAPKLTQSPASAAFGQPMPQRQVDPPGRIHSAQDPDPEAAAFHGKGKTRGHNPRSSVYAVGVTGIRG